MKSRKAQGLPLSVIIIAVILIVVLIVVLFIFIGGTTKFSKGLSDCKAHRGRDCVNVSIGCEADETPLHGICDEGLICCILPEKG
jgi:hypothetical protein